MRRPTMMLLFVTLIALRATASETRPPIQMDGQFDDWTQPQVSVTDPVGDAKGAFDLSRVSVVTDGTTIYIRFDNPFPINLQSGLVHEGTLRLRIESSGGRKLLIDFRERLAMLTTDGSTSTLAWDELQFNCLPTYATTDFELRIDLQSIGATVGDALTINFEGADALAESIPLVLAEPMRRSPADRTKLTKPDRGIRVASLNTLHEGSASAERAPSIKNLLTFAAADVYCFNEAWEEDVFRETISNVLPDSLSETTNLHWANTCGIVSRFPMKPLPFECPEAAALIQKPDGKNLVVVSVHFKCCGFDGSREDMKRMEEVRALLADLERMRDGRFGAAAANAGVIVLGDFNLVGSRKPLDLLNAKGIKDVMLKCPLDGSANTWRGIKPTESFWPGRLDYTAIEGERLRMLGGYLLNTEQLNQLDPRFASEVLASDHSMMVVDLDWR